MDRLKHDARGEDPVDRRSHHSASRRTSSSSAQPPRTGQYRPTKPPVLRVGEDRYRPGGRRTTAEPLSASWKPKVEAPKRAEETSGGKNGLAKLTKAYGWRVYALPILVVLTVLVVVNTATSPAEPIAAQEQNAASTGANAGGAGADGDSNVLPENPAKPVDLNVPTAVLPEGGQYTQAGKGTWHVVPGSGPKVGTGKLYTYTIEVEDGIDPASYAGDDSFATAVQGTLSNPQSWTFNGKFALQRVDASFPNPSFRVSLTTPETDHRPDACGFQITFEASCYRSSLDHRVLINLSRWVRGAKAFGADMTGYREYAINHEVGHALGGVHVGCGGDGQPAPVMMQQTFGVADDYVAMLNNIPGGDKGKVPADHRVCKPNSWPNPTP